MTNLGGVKLAEGGETGRELGTAEGGRAGAARVAEFELRICMAHSQ